MSSIIVSEQLISYVDERFSNLFSLINKIEVLHAKSQKKIGDFEVNKKSTILDVKKAIHAKSKNCF
jgi:hypothetical protein